MRTPFIVFPDTIIFTGHKDPHFNCYVKSLIRDCQAGLYRPMTSELVIAEMISLSETTVTLFNEFLSVHPLIEKITKKADTLANLYIEKNIFEENLYCDALNLAIATLAEADIFVTLDHPNFLHFTQERKLLDIHLELGLKPIRVHCPRQMASHDVTSC